MLSNISMGISESTLISKANWIRNSSDNDSTTESTLGCLSIEFTNGQRYQYTDVPLSTIKCMVTTESHGKFFHSNIKDKYTNYKEV
jgi:hypothetical protein